MLLGLSPLTTVLEAQGGPEASCGEGESGLATDPDRP